MCVQLQNSFDSTASDFFYYIYKPLFILVVKMCTNLLGVFTWSANAIQKICIDTKIPILNKICIFLQLQFLQI